MDGTSWILDSRATDYITPNPNYVYFIYSITCGTKEDMSHVELRRLHGCSWRHMKGCTCKHWHGHIEVFRWAHIKALARGS